VCEDVCDDRAWFARLRDRRERSVGDDTRRGLCENMRVFGGETVTDEFIFGFMLGGSV
jgi:hypothetical protein